MAKKDEIIDVGEQQVANTNKNVLPPDIEERIGEAKRQNTALMAMMDNLLQEGVDYGKEPGIPKPFLHQPGAQQLGLVFKFRPEFEVIDKTIDFNQDPMFISYDIKCKLFQRDSGMFLGEGVGSCNNYEKKYRYYKEGIEYEDPLDRANTYLKMSKKRAYVDATLNVTGATRLFTQDQDMVGDYNNKGKGKQVKSPDNPGDYIVPFGYSKGEKLKDCNESTIKWACNLKPNNTQGKMLKKMAEQYKEQREQKGRNKKLTGRQKEVKKIIKDDAGAKDMVLNYLKEKDVNSVNDLDNPAYKDLLTLLNRIMGNDEEFEEPETFADQVDNALKDDDEEYNSEDYDTSALDL